MQGRSLLALSVAFVRVLRKEESHFNPEEFGIVNPWFAASIRWLSDTWNFCLFLCVLPLTSLILQIQFQLLGPNPVEAFHLFTGIWALRFLCVTLLITPLQAVTAWRGMAPYRQLFGLSTFFYAGIHVFGYLSIDHALIWSTIARDILETPYIWPGLIAFLILFLLALTSPKQGKKLLGKNWKKLHRWIYFASFASILHYVMQLKGNLADPLGYGLIIGLLLACRILIWLRNRQITRLMIPRGRRPLDEDEADTQRPANLSTAVKGALHSHASILSGKKDS